MNNRIVIEPGGKRKNYWRDLWNHRGLLYFLAWRDVLVRYKQTTIGVAWSVLKPCFTIVGMMFIGMLVNSPLPTGVPRILLVAAATLPWQFFATTFGEVGNSLLSNSNLLTKVYFPRLIVPFGTIIVCLIDFFISLAIIIILMTYYHYPPTLRILLIPLLLLQALFMAMGAGLFAASLNVKYRDFKFIIPFIVQFGIFISPVAFSSDALYNSTTLSGTWKFIYSLNPMVGVIDGFRWCLLGGNIILNLPGFIISVALSLFFFITGIWYFRKTEKTFADVI